MITSGSEYYISYTNGVIEKQIHQTEIELLQVQFQYAFKATVLECYTEE